MRKLFSQQRDISEQASKEGRPRLFTVWDVLMFVIIAVPIAGTVAFFFCVPRGSAPVKIGSKPSVSEQQVPDVQQPTRLTDGRGKAPANNDLSISPGIDRVDNMLVDTSQVRQVRFARVDTSLTESYSVYIEGGIADAIDFPETFVMNQGVSTYDYQFTIDTSRLGLGSHEGGLVFSPTLAGGSGTEPSPGVVGVAVGIRLQLQYAVVGEAVEDIEFRGARIVDGDQASSPVLDFTVRNKGNTVWTPSSVNIDVYNDRNELVSSEQFTDTMTTYPSIDNRYQFLLDTPYDVGEYSANLSVIGPMPTSSLTNERLEFSVFRGAALQEEGKFVAFSTLKKSFFPNERVRITGRFQNTGHVPVAAVMAVEVYRGDVLVDVLRSSLQENLLGESLDHDVYFSATTETGAYHARAWFEYGERRTTEMSLDFTVEELTTTQETYVYVLYVIVVFLLVLGIVGLFWYQRRRRARSTQR